MTIIRKLQLYALLTGTAMLLAACGGGGSDSAPAPSDPLGAVPDSASQSAQGMTSYLTQLSTSSDDTREAASVTNYHPPEPDDTEPTPII